MGTVKMLLSSNLKFVFEKLFMRRMKVLINKYKVAAKCMIEPNYKNSRYIKVCEDFLKDVINNNCTNSQLKNLVEKG